MKNQDVGNSKAFILAGILDNLMRAMRDILSSSLIVAKKLNGRGES